MKANQVAPDKTFSPNWINRGSKCCHCQTDIQLNHGIAVGTSTYCSYLCLANKNLRKEDDPTTPDI